MFTITKNTRTGIQEVLTDKGFRSRESLKNGIDAKILYFDKKEGGERVIELRKDCRIKSIAKSIILNYS